MSLNFQYYQEAITRKVHEVVLARNCQETADLTDIDNIPLGKFSWHFLPYTFIPANFIESAFVFEKPNCPRRLMSQNVDLYNPLAPIYFVLILLNQMDKSQDWSAFDRVLCCVDYLLDKAHDSDDFLAFNYEFEVKRFNTSQKWYSGIAQGLAASMFARLYAKTGDVVHMKNGIKACRAMEVPIGEGGVLSLTPEGDQWIEEYPGMPHSYVLNGYLFSLIGILESEIVMDYAPTAFSSGAMIRSLLKNYPHYVCGRYLKYDRLHNSFCNPHYMGLHALLLLHLYKLAPSTTISHWAKDLKSKTHWPLYFRSIYGSELANIESQVSRTFEFAS